MAYTEPIVDFLITVDPNLDYGPDWMPPPDPPVALPGFGQRISWAGVFDWVKSGYDYFFGGGVPLDIMTTAQVKAAVDAAVGQLQKALTGYMNQTAAMTIQAAAMLSDEINVQAEARVSDYNLIQQQIGILRQTQDAILYYIVPIIETQIHQSTATAYTYALQAEANAIRNAQETIFNPLFGEILKVQPAIDQGVQTAITASHADTITQVAKLGAAVGVVVNGIRSELGNLKTVTDECTVPMCDVMGPKTNLGKLLKALSLAAEAAAIADLLSLTEPELVQRLTDTIAEFARFVSTIETEFLTGGRTIGATIAGL